ncbi:MAG: hypothetical protein Crog4KO_24070 [Crocinitomicaceae bacterium]
MTMDVSVPDINDKDLEKLLTIMSSDIELIELKIEPEPSSQISDCTEIVRKKVENEGGRIIYGWQFWKTPFLIEAEFHAVWEMPDGKTLKDLTPKPEQYGFEHILFLEDEELKYEGKQIDNIRVNITDNALVDHFIESCKAVYRLQNRGKRALVYDLREICTEEEIKEIVHHVNLRATIAQLLNDGKTIEDLCFCNSMKKYKNCHGSGFIKKIRQIR